MPSKLDVPQCRPHGRGLPLHLGSFRLYRHNALGITMPLMARAGEEIPLLPKWEGKSHASSYAVARRIAETAAARRGRRRCRDDDHRLQLGRMDARRTARALADSSANNAVVAAVAPICVDQFQRSADASAKLAELKKASSWERATFVEKGGWAVMPGSKTIDSGVAQACATMLDNLR